MCSLNYLWQRCEMTLKGPEKKKKLALCPFHEDRERALVLQGTFSRLSTCLIACGDFVFGLVQRERARERERERESE
jgi:hypothetical protein